MDAQSESMDKFGNNTQPYTVLVEGNIGSGKTSLIKHFEQYPEIFLLPEPVEEWRNFHGVNLLEQVYKHPDSWYIPFQFQVFHSMLENHLKTTNKNVKIMERSIFSAFYIFVKQLRDSQKIDKAQYEIFKQWFNFMLKTIHIQVDLIVYVRASPEIVYKRIMERARVEELDIPIEYLYDLHILHEKWLMQHCKVNNIPIFVLNADLDKNEIQNEYNKLELAILHGLT